MRSFSKNLIGPFLFLLTVLRLTGRVPFVGQMRQRSSETQSDHKGEPDTLVYQTLPAPDLLTCLCMPIHKCAHTHTILLSFHTSALLFPHHWFILSVLCALSATFVDSPHVFVCHFLSVFTVSCKHTFSQAFNISVDGSLLDPPSYRLLSLHSCVCVCV